MNIYDHLRIKILIYHRKIRKSEKDEAKKHKKLNVLYSGIILIEIDIEAAFLGKITTSTLIFTQRMIRSAL